MEINKIQLEQLNLQDVQTSFTVDDVNGLDDAATKATNENNELKEEISSALNVEDDASSLQLEDKNETTTTKKSTNNILSNLFKTQNLMSTLSNEVKRNDAEQKAIEEEIQSKSEDYQELAQELEEKQAEYEKLVSEAQESNDESVIEKANSLGEEINSKVSDLERIKTSIDNLETNLSSKQSMANTYNTQLNSLSKVESKLSKEAAAIKEAAQTSATNSVTSADAVQEVNNIGETTQTQANPSTSKREIKSMDEYMTMMDEKYSDLFEKLKTMDSQSAYKMLGTKTSDSISGYANLYASEFYDADGDGRVTEIDNILWKNYLNKYNSEFSDTKVLKNCVTSQEALKGGLGTGIQRISKLINMAMTTNAYLTTYNLDDLEQINKLIETSEYTKEQLGISNGFGSNMELNIADLAKDDNWEQKLDSSPINSYYIKGNDIKNRVANARKFIENNPDNQQYASIAAAYQVYLANCEKVNQALYNTNNYDGTETVTAYDVTRYNTNVDKAYEYSGINFSQQELNNLVKGQIIYDKYLKTTLGLDLNDDGKMNFKDLNNFCTELDLDGDGNISDDEKSFLQGLKQQMYAKVSRHAESDIEDDAENVINYLDFKENNSFVSDMQKGVYSIYEKFASSMGENLEEYKNKDGLLNTGRDTSQKTVGYWKMSLAVVTSDVYAKYGVYPGIGVTYDIVVNLRERIKNNSYSQQELQSILDKIKSSSTTAQSQLAEVKALIEQKLAAM